MFSCSTDKKISGFVLFATAIARDMRNKDNAKRTMKKGINTKS